MLPTMKQHFLFPFQGRSWGPASASTESHKGGASGRGRPCGVGTGVIDPRLMCRQQKSWSRWPQASLPPSTGDATFQAAVTFIFSLIIFWLI